MWGYFRVRKPSFSYNSISGHAPLPRGVTQNAPLSAASHSAKQSSLAPPVPAAVSVSVCAPAASGRDRQMRATSGCGTGGSSSTSPEESLYPEAALSALI